MFSPEVLAVAPGSTVTVVNQDSVAHTVTADTGGSFDTGEIPPGGTAAFTAPSVPGADAYHCSIHPFMAGSLTVG
ncbi:hypothetical protein LO772_00625 [Yinghuangia sp. ASG 101]|nr:hypothetical protein LO772_00625 [Yinghuangia sp. ASG 101]